MPLVWIVLAALGTWLLIFLFGHRILYVMSITEIPGATVSEVFDFVTNIENDHLWYDGIERTKFNIEGAPDMTGRQYTQYGKFNGLPFKNVITFKVTNIKDETKHLNFIGDGGVVFYSALYLFEAIDGGVRFVNTSTVANIRVGYLITNPLVLFSGKKSEQSLVQYTNDAQHRLLAALKREGSSNVQVKMLKF